MDDISVGVILIVAGVVGVGVAIVGGGMKLAGHEIPVLPMARSIMLGVAGLVFIAIAIVVEQDNQDDSAVVAGATLTAPQTTTVASTTEPTAASTTTRPTPSPEGSLTIDRPQEGATDLGRTVRFEGTASVPAGMYAWLLVQPPGARFFLEGQVIPDATGRWLIDPVYLGGDTAEDTKGQFLVVAVMGTEEESAPFLNYDEVEAENQGGIVLELQPKASRRVMRSH